MIELPRAAIVADKIAEIADFFSFGTNDLTQTVFGLSRDDAGKFLPHYVEQGILPKDPFVSIDVEGVGEMMRLAARARPQDQAEAEARHLRRARRRSGVDRVLPGGRAGLRLVQPVPRAGGAAGGGAGGAREWRATARREPLVHASRDMLGISLDADRVDDARHWSVAGGRTWPSGFLGTSPGPPG